MRLHTCQKNLVTRSSAANLAASAACTFISCIPKHVTFHLATMGEEKELLELMLHLLQGLLQGRSLTSDRERLAPAASQRGVLEVLDFVRQSFVL